MDTHIVLYIGTGPRQQYFATTLIVAILGGQMQRGEATGIAGAQQGAIQRALCILQCYLCLLGFSLRLALVDGRCRRFWQRA